MILERCSCGAKFKAEAADSIKLWREWRRKHPCPDREALEQTNSTANTQVEQAPLGFAPNEHPGRQDPALDE